jgi:hypothetical protein
MGTRLIRSWVVGIRTQVMYRVETPSAHRIRDKPTQSGPALAVKQKQKQRNNLVESVYCTRYVSRKKPTILSDH